MTFIDQLRAQIPQEVFTEQDIKVAFGTKSSVAVLSGLSRALRAGDIIKLKRGVYLFDESLRRGPISKLTVANRLLTPSYVSFESALSYHGLIPEAVYTTTSASPQRQKKSYQTPLGNFSYTYIPCHPFFIGVTQHKNEAKYLLANPVKALFDLIYARRKIYETVDQLIDDWRVNQEELATAIAPLSYRELEVLALSYKKKNTQKFFELLVRTLK